MTRHLNKLLVLLILSGLQVYGRQEQRGTTLFLADGKVAHLVPTSVVRRTMDETLSLPGAVDQPANTGSVQGYRYVIQVGTFAVKENAFRLDRNLRKEGFLVKVWQYVSRGKRLYYVVTVGEFPTTEEAVRRLGAINKRYNLEGLVLAQGHMQE